MTIHSFEATVSWAGSTGSGYDAYDRTHRAACPPAAGPGQVSAAPAFRGDPAHPDPEQLVALAAASCQLLSFLAAAARARLDVVGYEDRAEARMPDDGRPVRITEILLRPRITVSAGTPVDRVLHLVEVGHRECFVANSLACPVTVEPTVVEAPAR